MQLFLNAATFIVAATFPPGSPDLKSVADGLGHSCECSFNFSTCVSQLSCSVADGPGHYCASAFPPGSPNTVADGLGHSCALYFLESAALSTFLLRICSQAPNLSHENLCETYTLCIGLFLQFAV